jgi:hypothetical protein
MDTTLHSGRPRGWNLIIGKSNSLSILWGPLSFPHNVFRGTVSAGTKRPGRETDLVPSFSGSIPGITRFSEKENSSGSGTGSIQPREYN